MKQTTFAIFVVFIFICIHGPSSTVQLNRQNVNLNRGQHFARDVPSSIYDYERSQDQKSRNNHKSQPRLARQKEAAEASNNAAHILDNSVYLKNNNNNLHISPSHSSMAKQSQDLSSAYLNQAFNTKFDSNHAEFILSCNEAKGFSPGQMRLCQLYPDHVLSVLQAYKLASEECQFQFSMRRWNCSLFPWGNHSSMLVPPTYIKSGSKEVSVVKAFMSAAITFVTARACREGLLSQCSCSRRQKPKDLPEDWVWGGCGDNTEYGFMFGVGFVDSREKEMNHPRHSKELLQMLSNTHNNQVGRKIVISLSKPGCKCHGVSGSCSLKTCWHQLPSFRMIGHELKAKYDNSAVMVKFNKAGTNLIHSYSERKRVVLSEEALRKVSAIKSSKKYPKNPTEFISSNDVINSNGTDQKHVQASDYSNSPGEAKDLKRTNDESAAVRGSIAIKRRVYRQFGKQRKRHPQKQAEASKRLVVTVRRPSRDELVFTSQSTNFCEPSLDGSWPGTRGRQCKRGSSEPDGCDLMCCGRGYNTFRTRSIERCNCQFIWCCHVQCSSCEKFTDVHVCK